MKVNILALDKESPKPYPGDLLPYHGKELMENARDYMAKNAEELEIIVKVNCTRSTIIIFICLHNIRPNDDKNNYAQ